METLFGDYSNGICSKALLKTAALGTVVLGRAARAAASTDCMAAGSSCCLDTDPSRSKVAAAAVDLDTIGRVRAKAMVTRDSLRDSPMDKLNTDCNSQRRFVADGSFCAKFCSNIP